MKNLAQVQNKMIDAIYGKSDAEILKLIKSGKVPKEELIDIYRNNIYSTLTNALRITYPKIHQLLGAKKFKKICRQFIRQNRSLTSNLDDYGRNFADFFASQEDLFLRDLANFEWLYHKSYLARDALPLNIEELQNLSQEKLFDVKFKLQPACFLVSSNYNLLRKTKPKKACQKPIYFVIYRQNFSLKAEKIPQAEYNFLSGAQDQMSLYEIYEKYEIDVQTCLQKYLTNSVLAEFSL